MPFGIIGRTGPGMRQVVRFGIGPREGVHLGANLGRAIVTNGYFTAYVCRFATATRRGPLSKLLCANLLCCGNVAHMSTMCYFRSSSIHSVTYIFCCRKPISYVIRSYNCVVGCRYVLFIFHLFICSRNSFTITWHLTTREQHHKANKHLQ